ncbi:MAG TPA: hypothetical protein VF137_10325 [Candidatus Dormibacteraeota bacterium]
MVGARLVRTSGTLLLVGGLVLAVMNVFTALAFPGDTPAQAEEPLWTPAFVALVIGTMMLLFGAPVLYSRIAGPGGWMAQAGLVLIAIAGMGLGFFGSFMQALIVPWIASNDPSMLSASAPTPATFTGFYIVTGVIEALGLLALSVPLLRGRLQPRWAGAALALAAVIGVLSVVIPGSGMSANRLLSLLGAVPSVLLAVFFIEMGRRLLMEPQQIPHH